MNVLAYGIDYSHKKGEFSPRRTVPYYVLCCFSTPFIYEKNGTFMNGQAGELLLMPPGSFVSHGPISPDDVFTNDWLHVTGEDFSKLLKQFPLPENTAFAVPNPYYLKNQLQIIKGELLLMYTGYNEMVNSCLTETIISLCRGYQHHLHRQSSLHRIEDVHDNVMQHLKEHWTLNRMAAISGFSISYFSYLYSQRYGCSPMESLLNQRLDQAKRLLRYSDMSISDIAEECGFHSVYYFSKYFKKVNGIPPKEYSRF